IGIIQRVKLAIKRVGILVRLSPGGHFLVKLAEQMTRLIAQALRCGCRLNSRHDGTRTRTYAGSREYSQMSHQRPTHNAQQNKRSQCTQRESTTELPFADSTRSRARRQRSYSAFSDVGKDAPRIGFGQSIKRLILR